MLVGPRGPCNFRPTIGIGVSFCEPVNARAFESVRLTPGVVTEKPESSAARASTASPAIIAVHKAAATAGHGVIRTLRVTKGAPPPPLCQPIPDKPRDAFYHLFWPTSSRADEAGTPFRCLLQQCSNANVRRIRSPPVHVIAMLSQKGGAGKTTLAVNLAAATIARGKAASILDIDPQLSATDWYDHRDAPHPKVSSIPAGRIASALKSARLDAVNAVYIDTSGGAEADTLAAARAATYVAIPCQPSSLDISAIGRTVDICALANTPACIIINSTHARRTRLNQQVTDALVDYGIPIAPVTIGRRVACADSFAYGRSVIEHAPASKAAQEFTQLEQWLADQLHEVQPLP